MTFEDTPYRPVSCDFHDLLEAAATRQAKVHLEIRHTATSCSAIEARITDVLTRADGEYLVLDSGATVRLDRIVAIDGARRADYPD